MAQKILIVDDDMDTLQLVGTTLEKQDYEIIAAKDGEQALKLATEIIPDLILLDLMMPKMDGYEVTRQLRANPATAAIPIIMFTAKAQVEDKVEGLESGADDYLTKPTHPTELVARVKTMLLRKITYVTQAYNTSSLELNSSKSMIGIIAPKGGLGISTLAINLSVALREKTGEDVVVAEMQPGRGDISIYLGYNSSQAFTGLLQKQADSITQADVEKAMVTHPTGVGFLLASQVASDAKFAGNSEQTEKIVDHLSHISPFTILDLGANLNESVLKTLHRCDRIIVAIESTSHTVQQAKALLEDLVRNGINRLSLHPVLLNRTRTEQALTITSLQKELGYDLSTIFTPAPELAYQAANNQKPMIIIDPDSFTKQQTLKLVDVLI